MSKIVASLIAASFSLACADLIVAGQGVKFFDFSSKGKKKKVVHGYVIRDTETGDEIIARFSRLYAFAEATKSPGRFTKNALFWGKFSPKPSERGPKKRAERIQKWLSKTGIRMEKTKSKKFNELFNILVHPNKQREGDVVNIELYQRIEYLCATELCRTCKKEYWRTKTIEEVLRETPYYEEPVRILVEKLALQSGRSMTETEKEYVEESCFDRMHPHNISKDQKQKRIDKKALVELNKYKFEVGGLFREMTKLKERPEGLQVSDSVIKQYADLVFVLYFAINKLRQFRKKNQKIDVSKDVIEEIKLKHALTSFEEEVLVDAFQKFENRAPVDYPESLSGDEWRDIPFCNLYRYYDDISELKKKREEAIQQEIKVHDFYIKAFDKRIAELETKTVTNEVSDTPPPQKDVSAVGLRMGKSGQQRMSSLESHRLPNYLSASIMDRARSC